METHVWSVVLVYVAALTVSSADADSGRKKDREVSGLYPFPRVGRRFSDEYNDYIKRQGLIPFPRVGRGGNAVHGGKRDDSGNDVNGLWFGPRLGRGLKGEAEWTFVPFDGSPRSSQAIDGLDVEAIEAAVESSPNSNRIVL